MNCKKIVFTAAKKVAFLDSEIRENPDPNEVLVKLAVSTVSSGTERANLSGDVPTSIFSDALPTYPLQTGYSSSGEVIAVGRNVRKVAVGDRVALSWSTHSQYVMIPESNVQKIKYDEISYSDAALSHIMTFSEAAIRKCRLEFGESALVMGLGILGLAAVKFLKVAGACPIIAADPVPEKREIAKKYGADLVLDPYSADFAKAVRDFSEGGVNVAIEVTGIGTALNQTLDCMKPMGRVALLGCTRKSDFTVDFYHKVHGTGVVLIGANTNCRPKSESSTGLWTSADDIAAYLRLIHLGRLDMSGFVEETHSPADCESVYHRLLTEKSFPVTQFDWRRI